MPLNGNKRREKMNDKISHESVQKGLDAPYSDDYLSTGLKRVIIPMPKGVTGNDVEYTEWDGSKASGNGFLFYNSEDSREQFIKADGGIFIGHEGECPEGPDGKMISRSMAVKRYFIKHPDALSTPEKIEETIKYLQDKVFRHEEKDPTKWDGKRDADIWTSDVKWLEKNFRREDIYNTNGEIKSVISAAKKSEIPVRAEYYGPNTEVEGIGDTGDFGSYVTRKEDGVTDLCAANVFDKSYKRERRERDNYLFLGMPYPKGSLKWIDPNEEKVDKPQGVTERDREIAETLETPVLRVLARALCDYPLENPERMSEIPIAAGYALGFGGLQAMDKNILSKDGTNPKSEYLKPLLEAGAINEKGAIINAEAFVSSEVVKNFNGKGIDLSNTATMRKIIGGKDMPVQNKER